MRNHTTTAARADIGRTPQLCQDALIEMLKDLFAGKLFCGQEGRKALKIYKQDLPIPQSDDADVDTDKAEAPYIVVRMTGGQIEDDDSPQTVDFTFDNGTEFAAAEELERSCINKHLPRTKVYFCHPYSSWERGTNENTNGMIRRRFPKGTNFAAVTNAQITQAENWINNYPRKILGYKSSEIVFRECLRELGIAA